MYRKHQKSRGNFSTETSLINFQEGNVLEDIPLTWLQEKIELNNIEVDAPPHGVAFEDWLKIDTMKQDGDEIWRFDSPIEYWDNLCGRAGIALVRKKRVILSIVTFMN